MIKIIEDGDIFKSECAAIVCPVNCMGTLGKGLAKEFKKRYPAYNKWYQSACKHGQIHTERLYAFKESNEAQMIVTFPTKYDWREKSDFPSVARTIKMLPKFMHMFSLHTIAVPAVGCGLGGLNFEHVKDIFMLMVDYDYLKDREIHLYTPGK